MGEGFFLPFLDSYGRNSDYLIFHTFQTDYPTHTPTIWAPVNLKVWIEDMVRCIDSKDMDIYYKRVPSGDHPGHWSLLLDRTKQLVFLSASQPTQPLPPLHHLLTSHDMYILISH